MRRLLALLFLLISVPAVAQIVPTVVEARSTGQVGERFDGYLGFAVPPSPLLRQQVNAINIKRRALYSSLAQQRGVAPSEVGIAVGCTLLARVAVGEAYQLSDNQWYRRSAGQSAPQPDYCRP